MDFDMILTQRTARNEEAGSSTDSDKFLAKAVAQGDKDAWSRFFDRFLPWTYRFAYYHLGMNCADAEDLCSDILELAARSIGKYDATRGSLDIWMLGLAKHRLIRFYRRRRKEIPLIPEIIESTSTQGKSEQSALEDQVLTREEVHCILAALPERQVTVLIGKYLDGYSMEELARMLDTTPKAIEMLLRRGRQAFRAALNSETGGNSDE